MTKIYNRLDEQGRYCGFKATTEEGMQEDTTLYSYLYCRKAHLEIALQDGLTEAEFGLRRKKIERRLNNVRL